MHRLPWGRIRSAIFWITTTSVLAAQQRTFQQAASQQPASQQLAPPQLVTQSPSTHQHIAKLKIDGCEPLAQLARHAAIVLANQEPQHADVLHRLLCAQLRLADIGAARTLLKRYDCNREQAHPELVLAAFATMQRTTGERLLPHHQRQSLERKLLQLEQQPFASFASAALQVHGRFCLALLAEPADRRRHELQATNRLLALECETWQPGRGHYRPLPCHGELLPPVAADASLLVPLSYGMLLASGDRLQQHLRATLAAARSGSKLRFEASPQVGQQQDPAQLDALRLLAAAQLGDEIETARAFAGVVRQRSEDPVRAALHLTAAMQAVSGLQLAAGGGLGDGWLRLRPWLPPGATRIELRNVTALQHQLTVVLQRRPANDGLEVQVTVHGEHKQDLPLVVSNHWQQFVAVINHEQPFRCELPGRPQTRSPRD